MKKINCAVFMGDMRLQKEIQKRIEFFDSLEITKLFNNQFEMIEMLNQESPKILFINIDQHQFNALEVLKLVKRPPFLFAITNNKLMLPELLDNGFFDWISPKLELETFCKKMSKILNIRNAFAEETAFVFREPENRYQRSYKKTEPATYVFLKYQKTQCRMAIDDIALVVNTNKCLKVESCKGKVAYHSSTLKKFGEQLPGTKFIRINKSVIVNVNNIEKVEQDIVFVRRHSFALSRIYAPVLREFIKNNSVGKNKNP